MAWDKKMVVPDVGEYFKPATKIPPVEGLKVGVFAPTGVGKTYFAISKTPRPTFVIDTEFGARLVAEQVDDRDEVYIMEALRFTEEKYDVDPIGSLEDIEEAMKAILKYIYENKDVRGTVVIDSATDIWSWLGIWLDEEAATAFTKTGQMMRSVAPWSPVFRKVNGFVECVPIEVIRPGDVIWDGKWTVVKHVGVHPGKGDLVRVFTDAGIVDCTLDHSLVQQGKAVTPDMATHVDLVSLPKLPHVEQIDTELAYVLGFFLADGSRGKGGHGQRYDQFMISGTDEQQLERIVSFCERHFSGSAYWREEQNKFGEWFRVTLPYGSKDLFGCCYNNGYKVVPTVIWNASIEAKRKFLEGFLDGDGRQVRSHWRVGQKSGLIATSIQAIAESIGMSTRMTTHQKGKIYVEMSISSKRIKPLSGRIIRYELWPEQPRVVYDIETVSHTWSNGMLTVHNTEWGKANKRYMKLMWRLLRSKWHVILTGKEQEIYSAKGEPTGITKPRWQKDTIHWLDLVLKGVPEPNHFGKWTIVKCRAWGGLKGEFVDLTWDKLIEWLEKKGIRVV